MAVTLTAQQLAYRMRLAADTETGLEEPQLSVVNAVLSAASALVVRYAPNAPDAIHNEAVTRLAGFLYDTPPGGRVWQNPMQQSGATAILSAYRVQRAIALDDGGEDIKLRQHGRAEIEISEASVWLATGLQKPGAFWWVWQIAVGDVVSSANWLPQGALTVAVNEGDPADTIQGYTLGCSTDGGILLAGPTRGVTARITIWALGS